eukprot:5472735-Pyramimonas_sp.AAC.1
MAGRGGGARGAARGGGGKASSGRGQRGGQAPGAGGSGAAPRVWDCPQCGAKKNWGSRHVCRSSGYDWWESGSGASSWWSGMSQLYARERHELHQLRRKVKKLETSSQAGPG